MGAEEFTSFGSGEDAKQAFRQCVEQALYDYGHAGYSGSIAEKGGDGFVVIDSSPQTSQSAQEVADRLLADDDPRISDKWGPAGALRVKDDRYDGWLFFGWASS